MTNLKKVNMFATKNSVEEALEYGIEVGMGTDNPAAVTTALYVLYNTMIDHINMERQNELNQNN
jgi:hypothetical protein